MASPYYDPNNRDESDYAGKSRYEREGTAWGWLWVLFLVVLLGLAFATWSGGWGTREETAVNVESRDDAGRVTTNTTERTNIIRDSNAAPSTTANDINITEKNIDINESSPAATDTTVNTQDVTVSETTDVNSTTVESRDATVSAPADKDMKLEDSADPTANPDLQLVTGRIDRTIDDKTLVMISDDGAAILVVSREPFGQEISAGDARVQAQGHMKNFDELQNENIEMTLNDNDRDIFQGGQVLVVESIKMEPAAAPLPEKSDSVAPETDANRTY